MKAKAIKAVPLLCYEAEYKKGDLRLRGGGKGSGLLLLQVAKEDRRKAKVFLEKYFSRGDAGTRPVWLDIEVWYKKRTLAMNRLLWPLLSILSMEVYGSFGYEETLYEDMLDLFAEKEVSKLTGKARNIRSSQMDTRQMALLLDGVFRTLAENGVGIEKTFDIDDYWKDFYNWRGEQEGDPLAGRFNTIEEYRQGVVFCEACRTYLEPEEGQVAHIVGVGAHGVDQDFNLLRMCTKCHIRIQHQKGWGELLEWAPHLKWKVDRAHESQQKSAPVDEQENEQEQLEIF